MKSRFPSFVRLLLSVALPAIVFASPARACWMAEELETKVEKSPLIVVGKVIRVEVSPNAAEDPAAKDMAFIQVERVIKNSGKVEIVPGKTELAVPMDSQAAIISTAFNFKMGQAGVWLLTPQEHADDSKEDDKYLVRNPTYLQPADKEAAIVECTKALPHPAAESKSKAEFTKEANRAIPHPAVKPNSNGVYRITGKDLTN